MNIEFTVTKTLLPDTLRFELVHHRGETPLFRKVYRLAGEQLGKIMGIKSRSTLVPLQAWWAHRPKERM